MVCACAMIASIPVRSSAASFCVAASVAAGAALSVDVVLLPASVFALPALPEEELPQPERSVAAMAAVRISDTTFLFIITSRYLDYGLIF